MSTRPAPPEPDRGEDFVPGTVGFDGYLGAVGSPEALKPPRLPTFNPRETP